ncbi:PREDICTED: queuine tRNA-ribosyltransferase subunit QTRTD1 isoform X2 [Nanorana parkeri]|uniref:queuine tRNA-ribosyltransferase subunit QTRTD1 isoform X2 n=1 Tax=Nanorana parkeri TaxID=125878 RepID=UPI000854C0E9|nr:PREDICTED: queuine tRNA-ribosyltransferase subunit QTRTD1 isoform X2 [Nanorana parkeri]
MHMLQHLTGLVAMMKLTISKVTGRARLGVITSLGQSGEKSLEVPGCLLYTKTASPPHLTHDTLQTIEGVPPVTHVTLSSLAEHQEVLEEYKEGIGKFAGLSDAVLYCSVSDPVTPSPNGYNTNKTVSVWGSGGRIELTPQKFMSIQSALKVDWFQCLADGEVMPSGCSRKRAKKSVDRSLSFLDECLQLLAKNDVLKDKVVIGAIEGGDLLDERLRSARETAKRPVGGFLLDAFQGTAMTQETKLNLISSVTAELPEEKPRFIHGVGRPDEVLNCVELGVDLFDSSFPYEVAERGCALSFDHQYEPDPETAVLDKAELCDVEKNREDQTENDKLELDQSQMTSYEICLKEKRFREDFRPLLPGCTCYCCRNHSRAYVHHLLISKELLAGILLIIHNFQHYFSFFRSARAALRDGKLHLLKEAIQRRAP